MDGQSGTTKPSGIFKAMHAVMSEVGVIGKDRTNPQQNYKFRGIDDVLAVLQPLFVKHGIICTPEVLTEEREILATKSGGTMASVRLKVKHTYEAADGSTKVATTYGEAMDAGDKAGNKAMSAALKYAHVESFSIPTKESDRDTEEQSPEMAPRTQSGTRPQSVPASRPATQKPAQAAQAPRGASSAVFPGYGSKKGMPIDGAALKDLQWYADNCRKAIADPAKARWIDKERATLAALEAEIAAQTGGSTSSNDEPPPHDDGDSPF